jgi:pyridoxine 5-phosphate synthase
MVKLGVNIDHIATLRQQRLGREPDPVVAAKICEAFGADGITAHLREDRRHIQDKDVFNLKKSIKTKLNLEMAPTSPIVKIALKLKPDDVCLVPEKRQELTTEGGLDVCSQKKLLKTVVGKLRKKGICVSIFIDPELRQVKAAYEVGAVCVELHTGKYAEVYQNMRVRNKELNRLKAVGKLARSLGLILNAGHGLDYKNVAPVARIEGMNELNIGFSIIIESVFTGLGPAVKKMKELVSR